MNNDDAHEDIQEQIDDYILGLLAEKKYREIKYFIKNNVDYNKNYLQQMELAELIKVNNTPDPGSDFWQKFPDQVLDKCHQKKTVNFLKRHIDWWQSLAQISFFQPAVVAFAMVLAIVAVLVDPGNRTEMPQYAPLAMQNILWHKIQPTNIMLEPLKTRKINAYSFSKVNSNNAFTAGKYLSLSLAYFKKKDYVQSAKLLEGLKKFKNNKLLDMLIRSLQQGDIALPGIILKYKKLLIQLEKQLSADNYALFITGSWLADIEMAMASKQYHLLTELNQSQYVLQQLKSQTLPESIYNHLQKLDMLLKKDQYNSKKLAEIKWHISSIQNVLG